MKGRALPRRARPCRSPELRFWIFYKTFAAAGFEFIRADAPVAVAVNQLKVDDVGHRLIFRDGCAAARRRKVLALLIIAKRNAPDCWCATGAISSSKCELPWSPLFIAATSHND